jgi:peroxiredoxin
MSSYLSAGRRRAMAAAVCLVFAAVARAEEPPVSMQLMDASGHPFGNSGPRLQVKVTGRVLDADSKQPLPLFDVTPGNQDRARTGFDWAEKSRLLFTNGAFTVMVVKDRLAPAVLIEAEGYLPQRSEPIRTLETNLTFYLKKGNGPAGVVLTPDGRPAAHRTVYFSRLKDLIFLEGPELTPTNLSSLTRGALTDGAGRFSFEPDLDGFALVVADDAGFAQARLEDFKGPAEIRLQPWARLEGTLKIGTNAAAGETVRLANAFAPFADYPRPMPPYRISAEATTDNAGRFVFPRVPPADIKLFYAPNLGAGEARLNAITQITNLTLRAGETREVTLGGQGRAVVGRVVLVNYQKSVEWQDEVFWIDSVAPLPRDCPNFDAISQQYHRDMSVARSEEDKDAAQTRYLAAHDRVARQLRAYYSSPAGRRYWFSRQRYVLRFARDGSFRIDDVPGGKYEMVIDLRELIAKRGQSHSPLIALHQQEIDVPDAPGGRSDTPLDLGAIKMVAQLNPGDLAPDFAAKTAGDKTIKLSDYKGKYVLLAFWAASDAPSVKATPDLQETYAAFKNDPRFAMIGLSLDADIASARAFASKYQMGWTQGFLGSWSKSGVPDRFGVESLPLVMLIDPSGRILANGLRGGTIKSTVDVALSDPPRE